MITYTAALALLLSVPGLPLADSLDASDTQVTPDPRITTSMTVQAIMAYTEPAEPTTDDQAITQALTPPGDPPDMKLRLIPIGPDNPDHYVLTQTLKSSPDSGSITYRQRFGPDLNLDGIALNSKHIITAQNSTDPTFAPDSKEVAFVVNDRGWKLYYKRNHLHGYEPVTPVRFSPDGQRLFYMGRDEDKRFVVEGSYAHPPADTLDWDSLVVTPDSSVIAYTAYINGAWRIVVNGDPGPAWDRIVSGPVITSTGPSVFYTTFHNGQYHLVDRHTAGPGMYLIDSPPVASDDGRVFAYWAMGNDQVWRVFRNHKPIRGYDANRPGQLAVSADGQSLAAVIKRNGQWYVVQDRKPGPAYTAIGQGSLRFSPDSKRIAYAVRKQTGWAVIIDGKEQATYAQLAGGGLLFSPDSKRFVYVALTEGRWSLIEDNQAHPAFSQIDTQTIAFSPDSKRIAYLVSNIGRPAVVLDGQLLGEYDDVQYPTFSPDSKHLVYAATLADKTRLLVDGFPTQESFLEIIPGARIHFPRQTICQTVALRRPAPDPKAKLKTEFPPGPTFWRFEVDLTPIPKAPSSPGDAEPVAPEETTPDTPGPSLVDVPTDQ